MLYNEYNFTAAFAAASLLSLAAVITLIVKKAIELISGVHTPPSKEDFAE
jgi:sulfate transport system permease protein